MHDTGKEADEREDESAGLEPRRRRRGCKEANLKGIGTRRETEREGVLGGCIQSKFIGWQSVPALPPSLGR